MPEFDFDGWVRDVRDPARRASEGRRTVEVPGARFVYEVAPLPDGRWAVRLSCQYLTGDCSGFALPWRAFATRPECVDFAVGEAKGHFHPDVGTAREKVRRRMAELLEGGLFGFEEPDPVR